MNPQDPSSTRRPSADDQTVEALFLQSEFEYLESTGYSYLLDCPSASTRKLHEMLLNEPNSFRESYILHPGRRKTGEFAAMHSALYTATQGMLRAGFVWSPSEASHGGSSLKEMKRILKGHGFVFTQRGAWHTGVGRVKGGEVEVEIKQNHVCRTLHFRATAQVPDGSDPSVDYESTVFGVLPIWSGTLQPASPESLRKVVDRWLVYWEHICAREEPNGPDWTAGLRSR